MSKFYKTLRNINSWNIQVLTITILNAGRIESTMGNFQFYIEGVTQANF
jgi:hypothetical protein